jgi:hypothetical protein
MVTLESDNLEAVILPQLLKSGAGNAMEFEFNFAGSTSTFASFSRQFAKAFQINFRWEGVAHQNLASPVSLGVTENHQKLRSFVELAD